MAPVDDDISLSKQQEERLQAVIDSSPLALVEFALDTRIRLWNPAAERIFGWSREEMLGRGGLPMAPPSRREEGEELFARVRAGESVNDYETVRQRKDGTLVPVSIAAGPVRDGSGRVVGNMVAYTDISERKAQEQVVAEARAEAERVSAAKSRFVATMSHELRTPLAIILGQAKMMRDSSFPKRNGWAKQSGHTIEDSAQQLLSLVNDILDLARAEAGSIDVNPEDVNLAEFVDDMRQTVVGLVRGKGLEVTFDVTPDLPKVRADQVRLRQIILNLIDNAVKYTPADGKVDLKAVAKSDVVEVSVSDTGVGIPPEAGDLIFEPFFRVKGTRSQRGEASTGLGLALTRRLVEAQGGSIAYESERGVGTTVTFTLPIATDPARAPQGSDAIDRTPAVR